MNNIICKYEDARLKPLAVRSCGIPCAKYTCITGPYDYCNVVCGPGNRLRQVLCQKGVDSITSFTEDDECLGKLRKPRTMRNCGSRCVYSTSQWSDCSVTCGGGIRTRTLSCIKETNNNGKLRLNMSNCDSDPSIGVRPDDSKPCNTSPCRKYTRIMYLSLIISYMVCFFF